MNWLNIRFNQAQNREFSKTLFDLAKLTFMGLLITPMATNTFSLGLFFLGCIFLTILIACAMILLINERS